MQTKHPIEPRLGDLLLTFRRKIMDACRKEGLPNKLSMPELEVLSFIGPDGSATMKAIASHLKITPPSVTKMVNDMAKKGIVRRISDPNDRRSVSIVLSKSTKVTYSSLTRKREDVLKKMISRLTPADKKQLARIINILITD